MAHQERRQRPRPVISSLPSTGEAMPEAILRQRLPEHHADASWGLWWPGKSTALDLALEPPRVGVIPAPAESLNFARTTHLLFEGDNLDALKLLLPNYQGQVRLIYIDPPYNTGNAFIFADNLRASRRAFALAQETSAFSAPATGPKEYVEDDQVARVDTDAGVSARGRRRSTWANAHASWLSMLYPRLFLARELLRGDGALCLSIGEEEVHHARMLLDEVFGEEQHRNTLAIRRHDKNLSRQFMAQGLPSLAVGFEYMLIYARSPAFVMRPIFRPSTARRRAQGYWKSFWNAADRPTMRYPLLGVTPRAGQWKWREEVAVEAAENYARYQRESSEAPSLTLEDYWRQTGGRLRFIRRNATGRGLNQGIEHWIPPSAGILRTSDWTDQLASESLRPLGLPFDNPKRVALLKDVLRLCADEESIILDFFAGSGSTGQAVWELNLEDGGRRRFILVQRPEPTNDPDCPTIAEITKERLRRVSTSFQADFRKLRGAEEPDHAEGAPDLGFRVHKLVLLTDDLTK